MTMHITHLRTFVAVSRAGTFHSAAGRLNITQAAVSARIKTLEDQLGQRLFDRGRAGASLTDAGRQLLPHAERIIQSWDHATSMLGVPVSKPVPIRIGVQLSTWAQIGLDWAAWITKALPETELTLDFDFNTDMLKRVQDGAMDIAIIPASDQTAGMRSLPLPDETMVLVARRPGALGDAHLPPYIGLDWGPQFNSQIVRVAPRLPDSNLTVGNGILGLRFILEHDACGYVPLSTAQPLLRQKRLYRVRRAPKLAVSGHIVYRGDNPNLPFIERAIEGYRSLQGGDATSAAG